MAQPTQPEAPQYDEYVDDWNALLDQFDAERAHLRMTRDDVAAEVALAMKDAGLSIKALFMDPSPGQALLRFATDMDPVHRDWPQAR